MSEAMITRRGGGGGGRLQAKTVSITGASTNVVPDSGYDGMSSVTVNIAAESQKAAETFTPGTQAQTIAANKWLAGAQTIQGDANLLAANIKKGVSIFNVAGSYEAALDTNSAILKVVTSTGCSVNVSNVAHDGNYNITQLDSEGFVRSGDANVTEHFFIIPLAEFGTFDVTSTHPTYGPYTKTNAMVIGNAGKVYEVLCGGKNVILDGTFGLQDGMTLNSYFTYYDTDKRLINTSRFYPGTGDYANIFTNEIGVSAFDNISITARSNGNAYIELRDVDLRTLATLTFNSYTGATSNAAISNKYYPTARLLYSKEILEITEIILT